MSTTTVRVLIGSVIAACVLGIGALEVVSERVHVDPAATIGRGAPDGGADSPWTQVTDLEFREEAGPSPAEMTRAVQMGRDTVLTVDPSVGRVLSLTGTGEVRVSEVSKSVTVVTDERQRASLALLRPGDVIRVEAPRGQIQRIVVLRRSWQELESPEK
jgi:hypothetical protein